MFIDLILVSVYGSVVVILLIIDVVDRCDYPPDLSRDFLFT
jgi:hypothetical protein